MLTVDEIASRLACVLSPSILAVHTRIFSARTRLFAVVASPLARIRAVQPVAIARIVLLKSPAYWPDDRLVVVDRGGMNETRHDYVDRGHLDGDGSYTRRTVSIGERDDGCVGAARLR